MNIAIPHFKLISSDNRIQLNIPYIRMNHEKDQHNCQTPVKKWQQMSPLEDPLAIVESESSDNNELELFNELVGSTPSFKEESYEESYEESQSEEQLSS